MWKNISIFSFVSSLSLLVIAIAFYASRANSEASQAIFWVGVGILLIPGVIIITLRNISRGEGVAILLILALAMYLVKVLYTPTMFTFLDELQHWRTANNILNSGHLFGENPILTVSPFFPGLEIVADALVSLTGVSIYTAGTIIIGVSHLILILALYLFLEKISQSSRLAGIGTLIYMANPHFLLFDAQFGYESLGIPLAILTLYTAARTMDYEGAGKVVLRFVVLLELAAVIVTHHVTSFFLAAIFLLWTVLIVWRKPSVLKQFIPTWIGIFGLIGATTWLFVVAGSSIPYFTIPVVAAVNQLIRVILGELSFRQLFVQTGGNQQLFSIFKYTEIFAILLVLIGIPFGAFKVWQKYRENAVAWVLTLAAFLYPISLLFRFIPSPLTVDVTSRTVPYIFIGICFVLAVTYIHYEYLRQQRYKISIPLSAGILFVFIGMIASSVSTWGLPAIYHSNSYTNSVDLQEQMAAEWALNNLGPNNRFAAENGFSWVLGSYGNQRSVTPNADQIYVENIYYNPSLTQDDYQILENGDIAYLGVDRRNGSQILDLQSSFPSGEGKTFSPSIPLSQYSLSIFDKTNGVSRIFDSGDVIIYSVGVLSNGK